MSEKKSDSKPITDAVQAGVDFANDEVDDVNDKINEVTDTIVSSDPVKAASLVKKTVVDLIPDLLAYHFRVDFIPDLGKGLTAEVAAVAAAAAASSATGIYMDMRFQQVTGLGYDVESNVIKEGGHHHNPYNLNKSIKYQQLTLKRGLLVGGSVIGHKFAKTMETLQSSPQRLMISLLSSRGLPVSCWLVSGARPCGWRLDDLNAETNALAIETLKFSYTKFKRLTIG